MRGLTLRQARKIEDKAPTRGLVSFGGLSAILCQAYTLSVHSDALGMDFEWDEEKSRTVFAERRVDILHAALIFEGPVLTRRDDRREYCTC